MGSRQCEVLNRLLDMEKPIEYLDMFKNIEHLYLKLSAPVRAYVRDLNSLSRLGAITVREEGNSYMLAIRLQWATEITDTTFYQQVNRLPSAKTRLMVT
jgi:hypothetical protein